MQTGDVLDGRFEIEQRVGSGGMGEVFRARDRISGEAAAIKVLHPALVDDFGRFEREARLLAELRHPGIVRYVAHGVTAAGEQFLAMEWLEGEDLSRRLQRGMLTVAETISLATRAAEALSVAHERGVVHRDLKPSNLYLVAGDVAQVKVLDFGIAWLGGGTRVTATGVLLGTPGYMAPEQARSAQAVDTRADVFALGCVIFECLTGTPVFTGDNVMAVLAKILFEEAPRALDLRPGIPPALDALVARMLAKEPKDRARNGAEVAAALEALAAADLSGAVTLPAPAASSSALTGSERRVLSVVLRIRKPAPNGVDTTVSEGVPSFDAAMLRRIAEKHGAHLEMLLDGSVMATIVGATRVATDLAAQAARCALALHALFSSGAMGLATGRGEVTGKLPAGDVIDRASQMLGRAGTSSRGAIAIDEVTAGLLDARFEVVETEEGLALRGEREIATGARTLLGKPTACVGRDWELTTLEGLLTACIGESMPRTVLVTAPAGLGKSRLAHELMQRARRRSEGTQIWRGRGDSLRAGSAFGLLGQALRGVFGLQEGEPIESRRQKLRARVDRHVPAADARRVAEVLGEIVGTPFPDEDSAPLRAARKDSQLMGDLMRRAFIDFVRAEASAHPLLVVLEDLHWGDLPTVRFIDGALRELGDKPWLVLALARPEVHEIFPRLWADRGLQEIRLKELSHKASALLVRQVLGDSVGKETLERIVKQADGHAFYLEELIRAAAERKGEALPETVLAMVHARLEGLEGEARRVLRAASVFGEVFWPGGVAELLGSARLQPPVPIEEWLSTLVERELLVRREEERFPGERDYAFRHALLREGAYVMLTDEDRTLGHRLAGEWLVERGESDAMVLAEHFERGKELDRAGRCYLRAAEQAIRGSDAGSAIARATRGLACGVPDDIRAALLAALCEALVWHGEQTKAAAYAEQLRSLAVPGSAPWLIAVFGQFADALRRGDIDAFLTTLAALEGVRPSSDAATIFTMTLGMAIWVLDSLGQFEAAERVRSQLDGIIEPAFEADPMTRAWLHMIHTHREAWVNDDPFSGLLRSEAAVACFLEANHQRAAAIAQVYLGMNAWFLGAFAQAKRALDGAIGATAGLGMVSSQKAMFRVGVLADSGAPDEALGEATRLITIGQTQHLPLDEGRGRWAKASVQLRVNALDDAEREALAALDLLLHMPLEHLAATATLAAIQLAQGRAAEALATAEGAMIRYEALRAFGFRGAFARLVHAEALRATGDHERARAAIALARDRILANAEKIADPALRRSFLEVVPENARTLELARTWIAG